jgi:hypothetical protein
MEIPFDKNIFPLPLLWPFVTFVVQAVRQMDPSWNWKVTNFAQIVMWHLQTVIEHKIYYILFNLKILKQTGPLCKLLSDVERYWIRHNFGQVFYQTLSNFVGPTSSSVRWMQQCWDCLNIRFDNVDFGQKFCFIQHHNYRINEPSYGPLRN